MDWKHQKESYTSIIKCLKKYPQGVPLPTTYTKFVLELKIGKKENMANNAIMPHKTLSPFNESNINYKFLTASLNWLPLSS